MSSPKNMNARERARLAAEQAAARKRDQRILIAVIVGFVVVVVAAGIGFQAWRTNAIAIGRTVQLGVGQSGHHQRRTADRSRLARGASDHHLV